MLDVTYKTIWLPGVPPSEGEHPGFGYRVLHDEGMIIERDVGVKMRDGVTIYVDIFRPEAIEPVAPLVEWGPYGKHGQSYLQRYERFPGCGVKPEWITQYTPFEGPDPVKWCPRGYAIVHVDPRGTWYSEGDYTYWDQGQEAQDCYDLIEWVGTQEWSNGKVGMTGVSYLASIEWLVGALHPPHLAAISPWEGFSDMYREFSYHGGMPDTSFPYLWQVAAWFSTTRVEDVMAMMKEHPLLDEYWETKIARLSEITVPAYVVASWTDQGLHTRGTIEGFKQIKSEQKWLEVHRRKKWEYFYQPESVEKQIKFFDHFLKGVDNEVPDWPKVLLEVAEKHYVGRWIQEKEFPIARTDYRKLFLDGRASTLSGNEVDDEADVRYDAKEGLAQFDYEFEEPTDLVGHIKVKLWVEADGSDDMDLFVGIEKLDRNGQVVPFPFYAMFDDGPVAIGWLRVSHRELDEERSTPWQPWHTHKREIPLEPGERVPVEIEFWPSGTHFDSGEKLRLIVQGSDLRKYVIPGTKQGIAALHEDTRNAGQHVIHTGGQYDSHLLVPVIPSAG